MTDALGQLETTQDKPLPKQDSVAAPMSLDPQSDFFIERYKVKATPFVEYWYNERTDAWFH